MSDQEGWQRKYCDHLFAIIFMENQRSLWVQRSSRIPRLKEPALARNDPVITGLWFKTAPCHTKPPYQPPPPQKN